MNFIEEWKEKNKNPKLEQPKKSLWLALFCFGISVIVASIAFTLSSKNMSAQKCNGIELNGACQNFEIKSMRTCGEECWILCNFEECMKVEFYEP
jgi:hypothetical protein